jgi:hypothetical protein
MKDIPCLITDLGLWLYFTYKYYSLYSVDPNPSQFTKTDVNNWLDFYERIYSNVDGNFVR